MIEIIKGGSLPAPGICITCGSHSKDCVLFDVTQPWNGSLMICIECFRGVAVQFRDRLNLIPLSEYASVKAQNTLLSARLDNFNSALSTLRKSYDDAADRFNKYLDSESGSPVSDDGPVASKVFAVITGD